VPTPPASTKKPSIVSQKDFNLIIRIVKQNWWVPFIVVPLFFGFGLLYVYRLITIYKASTEFLLKNEDAYYSSNVLSDASFYSYASYIDNSNETRIIKSYDLASETVDRLLGDIQVSYFIVGKVRTTEYFKGMPFRIKVRNINPGFFEKVFDFRILTAQEYQISYANGGQNVIKRGKFNTELVDVDLQLFIEWTGDFNARAAESLKDILYQFSVHSKEKLIGSIRGNMSVENPQYTQILRVTLKDVIPERAVLILDTLNHVYAENKLRSKYELNERTIQYIDRQLNEITFSLKSIEDTMQNYKERKSIINLDWQQSDFLGKISIYDKERSEKQLEISAMNDLEKYIIEDKDPQFLPPSVFVFEKSGFMTTSIMDLYNKQIELNKFYNVAKEGNPVIADLKASIKKTKQDMLIYIHNTRKAIEQQIANINREIVEYINEAKLIPAKQRDVLNIQRKAAVNEQLYNFLLEKKASTKIARAGIVPDVKIVEAPRFGGVDSPDKGKIQQQFISVGLLVSLIVIFIRSAYFSKIKTVDHLKEVTDLPLVGVLPLMREKKTEGLVVDEEPNSSITEAFRNLRTNLQYANVDTNAKTFLVTSFMPGEGKTFTSSNLAALLAKSGKRTILIELDLHKPKIYKRFNLTAPSKGITTFVTAKNSFEEVIYETHVPNLHCIFAGPVPPNPSEFVLSEKLKGLLERARAEYEFVIIDTPPAGLLSDAVYLIQFTDASLFVLNTRISSKKVINFLENIIDSNKLSNVLLIMNGVAKSGRKYYYHSGYGYAYGYGYGYGYTKGKGY
jgi:capsular exopolysaccharide synthesis family protein